MSASCQYFYYYCCFYYSEALLGSVEGVLGVKHGDLEFFFQFFSTIFDIDVDIISEMYLYEKN